MSLASLSSRVTRRSRSNFFFAFLALPRPRRDALYAVYAFCRTVDDIADLGTDPGAQRAGLAQWRA
jgi:phytoene/squalene synthetase